MVGGDGDDAVGALDDGHIGILNGSAHHGAAHLQHHIVAGDAAAVIDDLLHIGAQLHHVVAGLGDEFAGDGNHTLNQRHTLLDGIGDGLGGGGVAHHAAHIGGQLAAGHLTAHDLLNEHLLSALGVLGFGSADADIVVRSDLFFHQSDGIGLVVLNEDHALGSADGLHHGPQAEDDVVGVLQHDTVVSGQVRLTLGAVDEDGIDGLAGLQLDVGGEGGAAHADDALLLDDVDDLVGRQLLQRLVGHNRLMEGVLAVVLDDNAHNAWALVRMGMRLHGDDGAADAGMDRSADEARLLADELANLHGVAGLNHGVRGGTDVHGQRDDDGVRLREFLQSQMLGVFFVLGGMDAAVEALVALGPGLFHISLDGVHVIYGVVPQLNGLIQEFFGSALLFQTLIDLLPGAVLLGVNFTFSVLGAAALAVDQTLGAVHNGADAAGDVQVALGAGAAGLLRQGHAVMSDVVQGVGRRKDGNALKIRHGLHAETAGDDHHILGALRHDARQLLFGLHLVAEEIQLCGSGDGFSLFLSNGGKRAAFRLFGCVELFEALVAGDYKEVILPCEQAFQFFFAL